MAKRRYQSLDFAEGRDGVADVLAEVEVLHEWIVANCKVPMSAMCQESRVHALLGIVLRVNTAYMRAGCGAIYAPTEGGSHDAR